MKPYPKIIRPEQQLAWNGSFKWEIGLLVDKNKPKIPLRYFSKVHPLMKEREQWLKLHIVVTKDVEKKN